MEKGNWVLNIQMNGYYNADYMKNNHSLLTDINKAVVFSNVTKAEMEAIAKVLIMNARCMWEVIPYEKALEDFNKLTYIDPETKTMKYGKLLNALEAIALLKRGEAVVYAMKDGTKPKVVLPDAIPEQFSTGLLVDAYWYEVIYL